MNKQDKELILKDLCARLPYGVVLQCVDPNFEGYVDWKLIKIDIEENIVVITNDVWTDEYLIENVKPYLRPMSSMTEVEKDEFYDNRDGEVDNMANGNGIFFRNNVVPFDNLNYVVDWLNSHHFDYSGMIEKGFALPAPDGMYQQTIKKDIAKKLIDILIYDNDFVNRETPLDESKHYGNWIEKVAEKVCFPNNDLNFYTEDRMNLFAVGDFGEKEELIKEHPELRELDTILNEYFDYLETEFAIK